MKFQPLSENFSHIFECNFLLAGTMEGEFCYVSGVIENCAHMFDFHFFVAGAIFGDAGG